MRVAALTQGRFVPAARFRVRQNIPKLKNLGVELTEYYPEIDVYQGVPMDMRGWPRAARWPVVAAWQAWKIGIRAPQVYQSRKYDITLLQRELLPGYMTLESMLKTPMVFDVDDAIWLSNRDAAHRIAKIAECASTIFAGNDYIAEWFSSLSRQVVVIPTAVDVERFSPAQDANSEYFTIGWIGTRANLQYLNEIAPALNNFLRKHSDAVFFVISDLAPDLPSLPDGQIRYLPWSESAEVEAIQQMDAGIMPLPENEWTRGKCSFKMLQYMSCGVPVIVSPVGMNASVLGLGRIGFGASTADEWFDAMEYLYQNRTAAQEMGARGRELVKTHFSTDVIAQKMAEAFKSIA